MGLGWRVIGTRKSREGFNDKDRIENKFLLFMNDKVSILVPIYGVEQYIERCARSLFEQTYRNLEYVFVNDCSPDRSVEVLKEVMNDYPDRKGAVIIVGHEKNQGLAAARNTALDHAAGDFVCIVDSDDWMDPDAVELLLKKQFEKGLDLVSWNRMVHYTEKESLFQERQYQNKEEMTLQMMQRSWDHFITGRLVKRSLFMDNGLRWNEGLDLAEDRYMMTLLAYHAQSFETIDRLYHYERRNVNAITKTADAHRFFENNDQELRNVMSLKQFFDGKEDVLFRECTRCEMDQLEFNLKMALAFSSKEEFKKIAGIIDGHSDEEMKMIGWRKAGIKGRCLHYYGWMRLNWLKGKTIRYLKKRLA